MVSVVLAGVRCHYLTGRASGPSLAQRLTDGATRILLVHRTPPSEMYIIFITAMC